MNILSLIYKLIKYLYVPGATILLYTFPMLFIAVLGSLYIHFGKNNFSDIAERYVRKIIDHTVNCWPYLDDLFNFKYFVTKT